jgi:hypothetical protein
MALTHSPEVLEHPVVVVLNKPTGRTMKFARSALIGPEPI